MVIEDVLQDMSWFVGVGVCGGEPCFFLVLYSGKIWWENLAGIKFGEI